MNVQSLKKLYIIVALVESLPVGSYGKGQEYTLCIFKSLIMTSGFFFGTGIWAETPENEGLNYTA